MSVKKILLGIRRSFEEASQDWQSLIEELESIRTNVTSAKFEDVFGTLALRTSDDPDEKRIVTVPLARRSKKRLRSKKGSAANVVRAKATPGRSRKLADLLNQVVEDKKIDIEHDSSASKSVSDPLEKESREGLPEMVDRIHVAETKKKNLEGKLDTLIRLVKDNLGEQGPENRTVSPEVTQRIAMEVIGRIKDTLPREIAPMPEEEPGTNSEAVQEKAISFADIESMIDGLSGRGF